MKTLLVVALGLLTACMETPYPVTDACSTDQVCIEIWQEGGNISFQINNNTDNVVTLPEFTGLGAPSGAHFIALSSDKPVVDAPVSSGGFPIAGPRNDTVLRPRGWVGFTLTAEGVRKVYRLSEGCQNVNVAYRVNEGGTRYFLGSVHGGHAELCL